MPEREEVRERGGKRKDLEKSSMCFRGRCQPREGGRGWPGLAAPACGRGMLWGGGVRAGAAGSRPSPAGCWESRERFVSLLGTRRGGCHPAPTSLISRSSSRRPLAGAPASWLPRCVRSACCREREPAPAAGKRPGHREGEELPQVAQLGAAGPAWCSHTGPFDSRVAAGGARGTGSRCQCARLRSGCSGFMDTS